MAEAGTDYLPVDGEWVLPPGHLRREVLIPIVDDEVSEDFEEFFFDVSCPGR